MSDTESSQINISDVIDVIKTTDPTAATAMFNQSLSESGSASRRASGIDPLTILNEPMNPRMQGSSYNQQQKNQQINIHSSNNASLASSSTSSAAAVSRNIRGKAYVKIIEQPASKALRFRYECEGRSAGSIPGVNSTPENKTFPAIEIIGYKGRAVVVVSCVTKDPPYRPHPHNLVGKEGCKKGVCTLEIETKTMRKVFSNLGIQCVKKKDIESALRAREEIRVDPFKTGFQHRYQPSSIDLNSVRLCFQVFLENEQKGKFTVPLPPVVSDPIYDKKAMSDLIICTLCSCSSTVAGGKEIILLCEKVVKEDISVRFYEEHNGEIMWESFGDFQHTDVHKQTAIKFKTPRYKTLDIDEPIKVNIQLRRPSDGATSESLPFDYLPLDSDPAFLKRKRQKFGGEPSMHLLKHFQSQDYSQRNQDNTQLTAFDNVKMQQPMDFLSLAQATSIKSEPRDTSPLPYNFFGGPSTSYRMQENSPSPQPVSPSNMYNISNTPSPYNTYHHGGGGGGGGGSLLSPNQHQLGGNISPNMNMDIADYTNVSAQQGYQQQQQQQLQQQFTYDAGSTDGNGENYDNQFRPIHQQSWNLLPESSPQELKQQISQINNFNINNLLCGSGNNEGGEVIQNHLTAASSPNDWNLNSLTTVQSSFNNNKQNQLMNTTEGNINVNQFLVNVQVQNQNHQLQQSNNNEHGPNLSSLLDMDSEQLIQINSAELSGLSLS